MKNSFKYCIVFFSKNDYFLLENWLNFHKDENIPFIFNLDIGSENNQRIYGEDLCKKHKIKFLKSKRTEMQYNLFEAIDFLKNQFDYILYLHTDTFIIDKNTFNEINDLIVNNHLEDFGCIGFNIYHDDEIKKISKENRLMTTARTCLQLGNGWFNSQNDCPVDYDNFKNFPFAVESVMWCAVLLNSNSYLRNIEVDLNFNFFHSWDDIAFQFMLKKKYNIVIPKIRLKHDQNVKSKFGLTKKSPLGKKKDVIKKYGRFDHHLIWENKYGFKYDLKKNILFPKYKLLYKILSKILYKICLLKFINLETVSRSSFNKCRAKYKNTMLDEFYKMKYPQTIKYFENIK